VYTQSARRWLKAINPAVGCHYFPPGLRLPSQPKSVTAYRPVPNYTARWQRHMRVSSLPKAVTWKRIGRDSNLQPMIASERSTVQPHKLPDADQKYWPLSVHIRSATISSNEFPGDIIALSVTISLVRSLSYAATTSGQHRIASTTSCIRMLRQCFSWARTRWGEADKRIRECCLLYRALGAVGTCRPWRRCGWLAQLPHTVTDQRQRTLLSSLRCSALHTEHDAHLCTALCVTLLKGNILVHVSLHNVVPP